MRRRCERLAVWLLLTFCFCGCTRETQVKKDEHRAEVDNSQSTSDVTAATRAATTAAETHTEAPGEIESTVDHRDFGVLLEDQDGGVTLARVGNSPVALPRGARVVGTVPLGETTAHTDEHRGEVKDEKTAQSTTATNAEAKGASTAAKAVTDDKDEDDKTKTKAGVSWLLWLGIGAGLVVAVLVLWKLGMLAKWWAKL